MAPTLLDRYANEALGPSSNPISLPSFITEIAQNISSLVDHKSNQVLDGLDDQTKLWLSSQLDVSDLRKTCSEVLADANDAKNFDVYQKSRYMAGSEDVEALADAQAILLMTAKHKPEESKKVKRDAKKEANGDESMLDQPAIDPILQEQLEQEVAKFPIEESKESRTVFARTPMPTASDQHKPDDWNLPSGLRMYRAFPEAKYYMRQTRASDMNTLIDLREHERAQPYNRPTKPSTGPYSDLLPSNEIDAEMLISVTFHPVRTSSAILRNAGAPTRQQRVTIPGSFTLADLRDALKCSSDAMPQLIDPGAPVTRLSDDHRPVSSYADHRHKAGSVFGVEGWLHADTRETAPGLSPRIDYAQTIMNDSINSINWPGPNGVRSGSPGEEADEDQLKTFRPLLTAPEFQIGTPMQLVRLNTLSLRVGEPYWFLHQGNCEHVLTVDEIRAPHPSDPPIFSGSNSPYPITTLLSRLEQVKCRICNRDPATRTLIDDELAGDSPTMVCDVCFHYLHGIGGQLGEGGELMKPVKSKEATKEYQLGLATQSAIAAGVTIIPILEELSEYV